MESSVSYDMEIWGLEADMNANAMVIRMVDFSLVTLAALEDMRQTL